MSWYDELKKRNDIAAAVNTTQASHSNQPMPLKQTEDGIALVDTEKMAEQPKPIMPVANTEQPAATAGQQQQKPVTLAVTDDYVPTKTKEELQQQFNAAINPADYGVETPEEAAKRKRLERLQLGYAGFVDGLNALSNLYFTTKGAPNQPLKTLMPNVTAEQMQNRAQRLKGLQQYKADLRKQAQLDKEYAQKVAAAKNASDIEKAKLELAAKKQALEEKKFGHDVDKDAAELGMKKAELDNTAEYNKGKLANEKDKNALEWSKFNQPKSSIQGSDGHIYTRNRELTKEEIMMLANDSANEEYILNNTVYEKDELGYPLKDERGNYVPARDKQGRVLVDWNAVVAEAADAGVIPKERLEVMGYKKSKYNHNANLSSGNKSLLPGANKSSQGKGGKGGSLLPK